MEGVRTHVAELYRRYGPMVQRRALWVTGNEADAAEVLQAVFSSQLGPGERRALDLYGSTTRACLRRLREQKNRARLLRESVAAGPARTPLAFDAAVRIRQALEGLPEQLAEVAVYYYLDELTPDEIGDVMGCSRRTVGNLLQRMVEWGRASGVQIKRTRTAACIGDLRLDQWRAAELSAEEEAPLKEHLGGCERCRERQALQEQAKERFEATLPPTPEWLAQAPQRRRFPWRKLTLGSLVVAVCASVALQTYDPFVLKARRVRGIPGFVPRVGGLPFVSIYVERGAQVLRFGSAQVLHPGDRLRFAYTASDPQHLAILNLDGAAHASVYYPRAATRAGRVTRGSDVLLPEAVTLDETSGEASIVAIFCPQSFPLEPLRAELEAEWSNLRAPAGCSTQQLSVNKR